MWLAIFKSSIYTKIVLLHTGILCINHLSTASHFKDKSGLFCEKLIITVDRSNYGIFLIRLIVQKLFRVITIKTKLSKN